MSDLFDLLQSTLRISPQGNRDIERTNMIEWNEARATRMEAKRRLVADTLKRCPLCGAVNAMANCECFVCRWHGGFDHDPHRVEKSLGELLTQCPELAEAMSETVVLPLSPWKRFLGFWRRTFRIRVDLRV